MLQRPHSLVGGFAYIRAQRLYPGKAALEKKAPAEKAGLVG